MYVYKSNEKKENFRFFCGFFSFFDLVYIQNMF